MKLNTETRKIKSIVEGIENLPSLPKVGMRILELAANPDVSMAELSQAIQQDPSLAARMLKIANSPFYGMPRHVDSLQLALVLLGIEEIRNVALGVMLFNIVKGFQLPPIYRREEFWLHCAGCGVIARILGRKLSFRTDGTDFVVGLLHDIGKIIIEEHFGNKFALTYDKTFAHKPPMIEAERAILGESHERFGEWLARKWSLPETLCDSITSHHDFPGLNPSEDISDPRLAALSYIAEAFCGHYHIGWDGDSGSTDVRNRRAWEVLMMGQNYYALRDVDIILTETLTAFSEVRPHLLWL